MGRLLRKAERERAARRARRALMTPEQRARYDRNQAKVLLCVFGIAVWPITLAAGGVYLGYKCYQKRKKEKAEAAKAAAGPTRQIMQAQQPCKPTVFLLQSVYQAPAGSHPGQYSCTVTKATLFDRTLTLDFHAQGDMSLGPLADPHNASLRIVGQGNSPVPLTSITYTYNTDTVKTGSMIFQLTSSYSTMCPKTMLRFRYQDKHYSTATFKLCDAEQPALNQVVAPPLQNVAYAPPPQNPAYVPPPQNVASAPPLQNVGYAPPSQNVTPIPCAPATPYCSQPGQTLSTMQREGASAATGEGETGFVR